MPDLSAVPAIAVSAFDFAGEDGYPAIAFLPFPAPFDSFLHPVEYLRADDGFVVVFHIVLRHFPLIILGFLRQEIDGEPLPMTPGDVFRNAPAFFLCQAAHDSDEEFPFTANFDDGFTI